VGYSGFKVGRASIRTTVSFLYYGPPNGTPSKSRHITAVYVYSGKSGKFCFVYETGFFEKLVFFSLEYVLDDYLRPADRGN
jgi:hypothetical protein